MTVSLTPEQYAAKIKENGVDSNTSLGIPLALAHAANAWNKLPKDQRTAANAEKLAKDAPMREDNDFLKSAGTGEIVRNYTQVLIDRSKEQDKQENKAEGSNLVDYMNKAGAAVQRLTGKEQATPEEVDAAINNAKIGMVPTSTLNDVKTRLSEAADKHLGMKGKDFLDDFKEEVTKNKGDNKVTQNVAPISHSEGSDNPLVMLLLLILSLLTGKDVRVKGMNAFENAINGDPNKPLEPPVKKEAKDAIEGMVDAAKRLNAGDFSKRDEDVETLRQGALKLAGKEDDGKAAKFSDEQAKKLADQTLNDMTQVLQRAKKPEDMGKAMLKSIDDANAPAAARDAARHATLGQIKPEALAAAYNAARGAVKIAAPFGGAAGMLDRFLPDGVVPPGPPSAPQRPATTVTQQPSAVR